MDYIAQLGKHRALLYVFGIVSLLLTMPLLLAGEVKSQFDWFDLLGEGGTALALALWLFLILISRPSGRVTRLLFFGLYSIFWALLMDAVDEIILMDSMPYWYGNLESAAMPFGVILLTWGLYQWHVEQVSINRQLSSREGIFRDHRLLDPLTDLASLELLCQQLCELRTRARATPVVILMISLDDWFGFTRRHGHVEADHTLARVAELIMLHLQQDQWLSRYAGSQMIVVLPGAQASDVADMSDTLALAISLLTFFGKQQKERLSATVVAETWKGEEPREWLHQLSARLKTQHPRRVA